MGIARTTHGRGREAFGGQLVKGIGPTTRIRSVVDPKNSIRIIATIPHETASVIAHLNSLLRGFRDKRAGRGLLKTRGTRQSPKSLFRMSPSMLQAAVCVGPRRALSLLPPPSCRADDAVIIARGVIISAEQTAHDPVLQANNSVASRLTHPHAWSQPAGRPGLCLLRG